MSLDLNPVSRRIPDEDPGAFVLDLGEVFAEAIEVVDHDAEVAFGRSIRGRAAGMQAQVQLDAAGNFEPGAFALAAFAAWNLAQTQRGVERARRVHVFDIDVDV